MKIQAIFDNGGKTLDRYTVVVDNNDDTFTGKWWDMLGVAEGGEGFSQWTEGNYYLDGDNSHLGRRVTFDSLSEATQKHIAKRVFGNDE